MSDLFRKFVVKNLELIVLLFIIFNYAPNISYAQQLNDYNAWNIDIPDNTGEKACSDLGLSGALDNAKITKVKIYYEIKHTYPRDLDIWITFYDNGWHDYFLYHKGDLGSEDNVRETRDNIHDWDGFSPNQIYYLCAKDGNNLDTGYIDFFELWIDYKLPPDLIVDALWTNPEIPKVGEDVDLHCRIKNNGKGSSGTYRIRYYIDDNYIDDDTGNDLAPNATDGTEEEYNYQFTSSGYHTYKVVVDQCENEIITSNNWRAMTVWVDPPNEADLAVTNLAFLPQTINPEANPSDVSFILYNWGPRDLASPNYKVKANFFISRNSTFGDGDDEKIGDNTYDIPLSSGSSTTIILTSSGRSFITIPTSASGDYYVFVQVEHTSPSVLSDPNSGNNYEIRSGTIHVVIIPEVPTLISPSNGSSTDPRPTFDWSDVDGATGYEIQIDNNVFSTTSSNYTPSSDLSQGVHSWKVRAENSAGYSEWSLSQTITDIDDLYNVSEIPNNYYLSNNYPNPFNPTTTISFGLPEQSIVSLQVFDITGKVVEELLQNEYLPAGTYNYSFNAKDLASGIYFYRLHTNNNFVETKKLILMK